jgi:hypothetical protein
MIGPHPAVEFVAHFKSLSFFPAAACAATRLKCASSDRSANESLDK